MRQTYIGIPCGSDATLSRAVPGTWDNSRKVLQVGEDPATTTPCVHHNVGFRMAPQQRGGCGRSADYQDADFV